MRARTLPGSFICLIIVLLMLATWGQGLAAADPPVLTSSAFLSASPGADGALRLELSEQLFSSARQHDRFRLEGFPLTVTRSVDLVLERSFLTTPSTRIVLMTEAGEVPASLPEILTYQGHIEGDPTSRVSLSITPEGVRGLIEDADESYLLAPDRAVDMATIMVSAVSTLELEPGEVWDECQVASESRPAVVTHDVAKQATYRICRVALECDYEYWQNFSNLNDAFTDIYTVFNALDLVYGSDLSVRMVLPFIRIWTTPSDPYSYVGGLATGLHEFQDYWRANHNGSGTGPYVIRDLAHLMSGRGVGAWGNIGVVCDYTNGFSISGGNGAGTGLALLHDIFFVGHELGHNFGGIHTFCFNPPLDHCVVGCNSTYQDCGDAPGTMMSYCHNCGGYGSGQIRHEFAPENISLMRTEIDSSCLAAALSIVYVDWTNSSGIEIGSITWPFNTAEEGVQMVLPDGTVYIRGGSYDEPLDLWQSMVITGYSGTVIIGQ